MEAVTDVELQSLSIRTLLERLKSGQIRIPAFQRKFVWTSDKVAQLMDSIYKGYPVGAILLWRTHERLECERSLGPFILPAASPDYPIDYVLDGQQRLTSLFGTFASDCTADPNSDWDDVYFDISSTSFVAIPSSKADADRYFPLRCVFDPVEYRRNTHGRPDQEIVLLDELQRRFQEATIPVETIQPARNDVAIVFERINTTGVPLDTFQLLSAWTWSHEFDLTDRFDELASELEPFGFGSLSQEPDLLLKCCSAVVRRIADPSSISNLDAVAVRDRFDDIVAGIKTAIDFLRTNLNVYSLNVMPYQSMLVPLSVFFAERGRQGSTAKQTQALISWFWKSCFSRRYSSGVGRAHAQDIRGMLDLVNDESKAIADWSCEIEPELFTKTQFNVTTVNTKIFILLLASRQPKALLSGSQISLRDVLQPYNRSEFHHIFPKQYLGNLGFAPKDQNVLANICFLPNSENQRIKATSPDVYVEWIPTELRHDILASAFIEEEWLRGSYEEFVKQRAQALTEYARSLIQG
ncbi:MAG: DUF262 domain-containing protein [Chloroflexi bacterium]|nr:DUF262 domain-containing protein [Chloroflexota bacterium]